VQCAPRCEKGSSYEDEDSLEIVVRAVAGQEEASRDRYVDGCDNYVA
jgi:hypothetical protein